MSGTVKIRSGGIGVRHCEHMSNKNAAFTVRSAYEQQLQHGLGNKALVPRIPGKINQKK